VIDSLKDIAADLSKDETGSRVNIAFQRIIASGVELGTLHHQRKASAENKKPKTLSDVYGSTWLTSGHGSVVLLWGNPGDLVVELSHLKQPAEIVGPLELLHDHDAGSSRVLADGMDIRVHLKRGEDVTVREAAQRLAHKNDPTRNEIEQARRKLRRLVREGRATVREGSNPGTAEKIYRLLDADDLLGSAE
jgi:replicative DNA helicase